VIESGGMPDQAALDAIKAVVQTIAPRTEAGPGAADMDVHRHVAESIDAALPGFVPMLVMLLDAYAADVRAGAAFVDLSREERGGVLRTMAGEQTQDMKEIVGALFLFTFGGMFSDWSGYERSARTLNPPWTWEALRFRGPAPGHPIEERDASA
jgi:hypothetical protein